MQRRHSLPVLHPVSRDVVFCLLLRKHTGAVSCSVLALAREDSGLVYSWGKYLVLSALANPRITTDSPMGRGFHRVSITTLGPRQTRCQLIQPHCMLGLNPCSMLHVRNSGVVGLINQSHGCISFIHVETVPPVQLRRQLHNFLKVLQVLHVSAPELRTQMFGIFYLQDHLR